ncbi:membrane integrity-associated transporter subunit PqiC [Celerinatantimonas sp. MCCC 1A17872]|uniref:PqiC family protein n=1 Tax=Celerinatantimonas sp. MCCC 1A17872 TaxID=3177514 RepID=UPI0038C2042E
MNKKIGLAIAFMLLALVGCSSSKQVVMHQYLLPELPVVDGYAKAKQPLALTLEPIRLPAYLDSTRMTMVDADGGVYQASHHLWAEDLSSQMQRLGKLRLKQRLPQIQWVDSGYRLIIHADTFSADSQGIAHLKGYWQLLDSERKPVLSGSFAKKQPLTQSGYLAMSQALSDLWGQTIDNIAQQLANSQPPF